MGRLIWLIILLGTLAFAIGTYVANDRDEAEQTERIALQLTSRLKDQLIVLEGVRALFEITDRSDDRMIRAYLQALHQQTRDSGFQGVGIALATLAKDREKTEARIRNNYGHDIPIRPQSDSALSYPVILVEPDDAGRHPAIGFDAYSEPTRRRAMQRAWTTGRVATSGVVQLEQDNKDSINEPGFLVYMPIRHFSAHQLHADISENSAAEAGNPNQVAVDPANPVPAFVYAPILVSDLFDSNLGPLLPGIKGVIVYSGVDYHAKSVYQRGEIGWFPQQTTIRMADTEWTMVISYDRVFSRYIRPLLVLAVGIAVSLLVVQLMRIQRRRLGAFRKLAEEKARHAEDRELMLGEMVHRLKNAFARVGALARITVRESSSLSDFEDKFEGRIRALAETKQVMVSGAIESLDLCRLIQRELELAGAPIEMREAITGPLVHLNDEGAQAIALIVHELVTNSIKYGVLAGIGDLRIRWRTTGDMVHLEWIESNLAQTPVINKESFGSHFIRSLIERTLHGEWQRIAEDRQLTVLIRWKESPDTPSVNG